MHRRPTSVTTRAPQRGVVLPLLAIGLLAIVGIVGLSIDVGHAFLNKTRLQNSLDSAALSGARTLLLTDDVNAASADARHAFREHLGGEMTDLGAEDLVLQYSDTLIPFVDGGSAPRYVRAAFEHFSTDAFFAGVLDGVGRSMDIAGTAVAGPVPLGYPGAAETCDVAPLLVCGTVGDDDCTDGFCFDVEVGTGKDYELFLKAGIDNDLLDTTQSASQSLSAAACGEGGADSGCESATESEPLDFLLHELGCTGAGCLREGSAGAIDACLTPGERASIQNVETQELLNQGLLTRFGIGDGLLAASDYPPDVVTTQYSRGADLQYDPYRHDVASLVASGSASGGVPYRRVLTVPVVSCVDDVSGQNANTVLGFLCLFIAEVEIGRIEGGIHGEFVERCEASGEQGESVPALSGASDGPVKIVLYKDPDSVDS